jgi:hypothetical protein
MHISERCTLLSWHHQSSYFLRQDLIISQESLKVYDVSKWKRRLKTKQLSSIKHNYYILPVFVSSTSVTKVPKLVKGNSSNTGPEEHEEEG